MAMLIDALDDYDEGVSCIWCGLLLLVFALCTYAALGSI